MDNKKSNAKTTTKTPSKTTSKPASSKTTGNKVSSVAATKATTQAPKTEPKPVTDLEMPHNDKTQHDYLWFRAFGIAYLAMDLFNLKDFESLLDKMPAAEFLGFKWYIKQSRITLDSISSWLDNYECNMQELADDALKE